MNNVPPPKARIRPPLRLLILAHALEHREVNVQIAGGQIEFPSQYHRLVRFDVRFVAQFEEGVSCHAGADDEGGRS